MAESNLDYSSKKPAFPESRGVVAGRVVRVNPYQSNGSTRYETLIRIPAPDPFTAPSIASVHSDIRFSNQDEDVSVDVHIAGTPNNYEYTDRQTGERVTRQSARNRNDYISHKTI